uniref:SFRICE_041426 n=1 Tax=Spodoptera frugiperda TaxID=7108 RepID=A0A2H1X0T9_SPOFR
MLRNLDVNKASGPDGISAVVLKTCAPETGQVPVAWKQANVQPVPKKGSRADPNNYRPISVTSERVLNNRLLAYLEGNDLLSDQQYGFWPQPIHRRFPSCVCHPHLERGHREARGGISVA